MKQKWNLAALSFVVILFGCSSLRPMFPQPREPFQENHAQLASAPTPDHDPPVKRQYKGKSRVTKDDFIDRSSEDGSLWASNGQTNYYFTKNRIRNPGDIITLVIDNDLYKDIGIEVRESLSPHEKMVELDKLREKYRAKFPPKENGEAKPAKPTQTVASAAPVNTASQGGGAEKTPPLVPELSVPQSEEEQNKFLNDLSLVNVDIYAALQLKAGDKMMGEIVERYPNGNYKVKASKRVAYDKGLPRLVSVLGVVKSNDIDEESDTINSGKLYEYRVESSR